MSPWRSTGIKSSSNGATTTDAPIRRISRQDLDGQVNDLAAQEAHMGSGEFGGGGSVRWQVRYNDPHEPNGGGSGKPLRGHGKDKGADTEVGKKMRVTCKDAILVSAGGGTVVVDV